MDTPADTDHEGIVTAYTVYIDAADHDELAPLIATTVAKLTGTPTA